MAGLVLHLSDFHKCIDNHQRVGQTQVANHQLKEVLLHKDLLDVRSQLSAAIARIDRILAGTAPGMDVNGLRWRVSPGGPLAPDGIDEIRRRFAEGETDAVIARGMGISVQGVQKRRVDFNATGKP